MPWWTYEEGRIPGGGDFLINVANGNLILQDDDVDVPERGIDLAFRRTYNHQTGWQSPWGYGGGWTDNLNARMYYDSTNNVMSVFDGTGARFDYCADGQGGWASCTAGMHARLYFDGSCGYDWVKKSGTVYDFISPSATCGYGTGYLGRLYRIYGRNSTNYLAFTYSWTNGDASSDANLAQVLVTHSDGQSLTLTYADFNGHRLLQAVSRPDGQSVTYNYDGNGNLSDVCEIGNGAATANLGPCAAGHRRVEYDGGAQVFGADWVSSNGTAGATVSFGDDDPTASVSYTGVVNPIPDDGTGQAIQSGVGTGAVAYRADTFAYTSTQTTFTDSDGHANIFTHDGVGRVTQRQDWNGSQWLVSTAGWDAGNNLTSATDDRGNETDYAYDANGNTIAVALPQVSTSAGTLRPTSLYSYDANNNVIAYCDPEYASTHGLDWVSPPAQSDNLCPSAAGATRFTFDTTDTNEPYGKLTDIYAPLGYGFHLSYDTGGASGDAGLPTLVQGDNYPQEDGTSRTPAQTFVYDARGNLTSYNKGNGAWTIAYDDLNRALSKTDPDGVASWTCYVPDDSMQYQESAYQHSLDGSPSSCQTTAPTYADSYSYDPDGNELTQTRHFGQTATSGAAATITKWYDGDDRLVEVEEPSDPRTGYDAVTYPWLTRYLYDLAQNQTVTIPGEATFSAHGNLYETQEYLPGNAADVDGTYTAPLWTPLRGTAYDALDRPTAQYEVSFGTQPKTSDAYGEDGNYGLLSSTTTGTGQRAAFSYDADGEQTSETFSNDPAETPSRTYTYDPDGSVNSVQSSLGTASYNYDADGRLIGETEPNVTSGYDPATLTYTYYGDGTRATLSVASSEVNQSNLFTYSYRPDGARQQQTATWQGHTYTFAWTYTNAGRELTQSDPSTGVTVPETGADPVTYAPKTYTYDAYGRVATLELPEHFTYTAETYDDEGQLAGYSANNSYGTHVLDRSYPLNNRGELLGDLITWVSPTIEPIWYGDIGLVHADFDGTLLGVAGSVDLRSGKSLASSGYDAAGRLSTYSGTGPDVQWSQKVGTVTRSYEDTVSYADTYTFDADSHISADQQTETCQGEETAPNPEPVLCLPAKVDVENSSDALLWGPDGHLRIDTFNASGSIGTPPPAVTTAIHYDGSSPLYTSLAGQLNLYIGDIAAVDEFGALATWDRDQSGVVAAHHSATAFSPWNIARPYIAEQYNLFEQGWSDTETVNFYGPGSCGQPGSGWPVGNPPDPCDPWEGTLSVNRTDGFGFNLLSYGGKPKSPRPLSTLTFQGARTYDDALTQWASPDAYAGDVNDPMSQQPFAWNNNNPAAYADPSGFCPEKPTAEQLDSDPTCTIVRVPSVPDPATTAKELDKFSPDNPVLVLSTASSFMADFGAVFDAVKYGPGLGRVFWSGYEAHALDAATVFAYKTGGRTLEMTAAGRALGLLPPKVQRSVLGDYMWKSLSAGFARGARGEVHAFIYRNGKVWTEVEEPILRANPSVTKLLLHEP